MRRRELLVLAGGSMTVTVAGCMGDDGSEDDENGNETDNGDNNGNGDEQNDQPTPATFDVGDVSLNETTVAAQATVELTAQITNSGEQSGTKTIELRQDGEVVDSQELELEAGAEGSVTFSPSTDLDTGEYEFTVLTEDSEGSSVLTIADGEFVVENIDPQVAELDQGQPLTVSADIVNQGPVEDTKPVELRVDGETVVEQEITLAAEGQQSVEFSEVDTSSLSLDVDEHSIWTPDDEALGSLTLVPVEPGTLELTVVDADGVGVGGATVTGDDIEETTDSEGILTLELDPGEYDLTIASAELETTQTVTIEGGKTTSTTVELVASAGGSISSLDGTNTGGFTAFDEDNESDARENGISFPPGNFSLAGTVSDGQWESTSVNFESFTVRGFDTQVEAPNGLSGTFDEAEERMTVEGQLTVTVGGDQSFSYEIAATTEESGALTGSADFGEDSGTATIVDNEFTVEDTTDDGVLNSVLGIPVEESGRAWFELSYDFDFTRE
ncbi:CARDB domain-containing protein [Halovenus sp. HT40]|uniref:CARDB domain-containing protein n=1 Tax=Halovenus sp. HT40 TaxID=3126691 RepID=UPI00300F2C30